MSHEDLEPGGMTLSDEDRRLIALWAADCAERVLPLFEAKAPFDTRPRDLWADSILPTADGGMCVIDWENSGPADPSHELGCVLADACPHLTL